MGYYILPDDVYVVLRPEGVVAGFTDAGRAHDAEMAEREQRPGAAVKVEKVALNPVPTKATTWQNS